MEQLEGQAEGYVPDVGEEVVGELVHHVLPLELLQHIIGILDPASVARAKSVCQAWLTVCKSPSVWAAVYRRHFSSHPAQRQGWTGGGYAFSCPDNLDKVVFFSLTAEEWEVRCVRAATSLQRIQSQYAHDQQERLWRTIKYAPLRTSAPPPAVCGSR
jgi:hypothetical protein